MVTGKNKEKFEEWYNRQKNGERSIYFIDTFGNIPLPFFYELPHEMQKGVYEAYYDSVGMPISLEFYEDCFYFKLPESLIFVLPYKTRKEAFTQALKEADKLINKEL